MIEQASLVIGEGNWAVKSDSLLGYKINGGKYYPREMSVVRATTGTRINEDGLVELVPYNLVQYSEQFDNAAMWNLSNVSVIANNITAPNGTLTADKITCASGSSISPNIYSNDVLVSNGSQYTWSVYAKKGSNKFFKIRYAGTGFSTSTVTPVFDLDAGTVVSGVGTIENVGNGWFRCSAIDTANANGNGIVTFDFPSSTNVWPNGNFNGTEFIYIWGAQLNEGTIKDYLPTTDRLDVARIDYSSGSGALLVEPQRTNLATWSNDFSNAVWTKNQSTITSNYAVSPQGIQNASRWLSNSGATIHFLSQLYGFTLGVTYTISCYVKSNTSSNQDFRLGIDGGVTSSNLTATTEWQRFTFTANPTNGVGLTAFYIARPSTNAAVDLLIYGLQLEVGSYATSYIPTQAATVTRNADVISKTGIADLIGQTEGTLFYDGIVTTDSSNADFFTISNTSDPALGAYIFSLIGSNGNIELYTLPSDTSIILKSGNNRNTRLKIAFAYTIGSVVCYINGVQTYTSSSFTLAANISRLNINSNYIPSAFGNTKLNQVVLFKTKLTNAQLATLTTI